MEKLNIKFNSNFLYLFLLIKLFITQTNPSYSQQFLAEKESIINKNKETLISKNNNIILNKRDFYNYQNQNLFIFFQYFENFLANLQADDTSINIISDIQSQGENEFKAEGNVIIDFDGKQLKSDKFIYDKQSEIITLTGNILFKKGYQYFEATKIFLIKLHA